MAHSIIEDLVKVLGRLSIELKSQKFIAPINHDRDR